MNGVAFFTGTMLDSSFVPHDVAPSEMDDVTQDVGIRDESAKQEAFFPQTLSDTTEEERHVQTRTHIAHHQARLSTG